MHRPSALIVAGALLLCAAPTASLRAASPAAKPHICGVPVAAGPLTDPPQIEVGSLPKDDRGQPELVLRVARDGDRFCYRYTFQGQPENVAPVLRVHRGETFDFRLVNELGGPATGATMRASAMKPCAPQMMPDVAVRRFDGYMHHTIFARSMAGMPDTDVNMHFHGFQGPPDEENVFLSTLSTPAHACEYRLSIPRTQPPGTYYYHSHAHAMAEDEISGGLGGMWIVEPDTPMIPRADEHPVLFEYEMPFVEDSAPIVDDAGLFVAGARHRASMKPATPLAFDPFNPPPWPYGVPLRAGTTALHGKCGDRHGGVITVNGVNSPAVLTVPANEPQLLRIIDGMTDSVQNLRLRDANGNLRPLDVVGRDGTPVSGDDAHPLAAFQEMKTDELVPPQRTDVLVTLKPGDVLTLYNEPTCNGPFDEVPIHRDLLVLRASDPAASPTTIATRKITPSQSTAMRLVDYAREHASQIRKRAFTYTEYVFPKAHGKGLAGEYYLTETDAPDFHEQPFWATYSSHSTDPDPDVVVKRGTVEEWYLYNATLEVHSFHIHQMDFVALDGPSTPATLDTTIVPDGTALPNPKNPDYPLVKPSLTRVLLDFRNVPRGTFLFHCHMMFHEDRGMMKVIKVV